MQVKDFLGRVKLVPNGLGLAYCCRKKIPGSFGLDSKKVYYLSKSVEAIGLDISICKCNATLDFDLA